MFKIVNEPRDSMVVGWYFVGEFLDVTIIVIVEYYSSLIQLEYQKAI